MYLNAQGVPQDYAQAVAWYRKAADQGLAAAQSNLGEMYLQGLGVPKDIPEARRWLEKAALQGDSSARSALANTWTAEMGNGVAGMSGSRVVAGVALKPGDPVRVSSGTVAGMALSQPNPVYPPVAKAAHVQGVVILRAVISKQGTIENLEVVSGPPMLRASANEAVKQWTYKPYILEGEPVEVETTINVNFTFGDSLSPAGSPSAH